MTNISGAEYKGSHTQKTDFIISTDLDGTLLDHDTYEWHAALPVLERLRSLSIPVVINTSKTYEEVRLLQKEIGLTAPFIVENGSAIYLPKNAYPAPTNAQTKDHYWQVTLGTTRAEAVSVLKNLRNQHLYKFESFFDMSRERIIELTDLSESGAEDAMRRAFSEPLVWRDSPEKLDKFIAEIQQAGMHLLKGGRFLHIIGQTDKAVAIQWFIGFYQELKGKPVELIALGDSGNDVAMLNIAEYAVIVRSPAHDYPLVSPQGTLIKTTGFGPQGWAEAISMILK